MPACIAAGLFWRRLKLFLSRGLYLPHPSREMTIMRVQVTHEDENGGLTHFGIQQLDHMPPVGEPFPVDRQVYYRTKAYFGPDENNLYMLILEGKPKLVD
jgi:hypothetical protein